MNIVTCPICHKTREVKYISYNSTYICRSCAKKKQFKEKKLNIAPRKCKFCGDEFIPNSASQQYCKKKHERICPVCGNVYIEDNIENLKKPPVACSYKCRAIKTRKTSLQKYGCVAPGNNEQAREKSKSTMIDKYGKPYAMEVKQIRDKARSTLLERYGVDNISKYKDIIDKRKQTCINRYGVEAASLLPEYRGIPHNRISKINKKFASKLEELNIKYEFEFNIDKKSYDIKLCDSNILIEINPTYTHNYIVNQSNSERLDKYYHRDKSKVAEAKGYRCIHIWDWDDWDKVIELIKPKTAIYARNCEIYKLNKDITDEFLNRNHLQGTCRGQSLLLGLVYDDELYHVMTFGKPRYNKNYDVELLRLCTKSGYTVIGGANKLFKFATEYMCIDNIISYCDRSKFNGDIYERLGMKLVKTTPPQEVWSKENKKVTSNLLRVRGYDQLFGTNYGKYANNEYLMLLDGWLPIYDCGQKVFEYVSQ